METESANTSIVRPKRAFPPNGYFTGLIPIIEERRTLYMAGITLHGKLSQFKVPEFDLIFPPIQGTYKACIDTGSYYSVIHPEIIQLTGFKPTHKVKYQHPVDGVMDDKPAHELIFKFDGYLNEFKEVFTVFEREYQYEVILGANFLSQCREFHYYGKENRFELHI